MSFERRANLVLVFSLIGAVAFIAVSTSRACAQDSLPSVEGDCAPEAPEPRRALVQHDETTGVWFRMEVARCMLSRLTVLPLYAQRIRLFDERLRIEDERHALMGRQVELAEESEQQAVGALEAAERARREAEEDRDFERSLRWVWFGVGAGVIVLLEALAIWIFSEISG